MQRMQFSADGEFLTVCFAALLPSSPTGNSWDLSSAVMDRALMHADGVYKFPAQRVRGHMCRTNIASNTAFRGFGGPQVRSSAKSPRRCFCWLAGLPPPPLPYQTLNQTQCKTLELVLTHLSSHNVDMLLLTMLMCAGPDGG